MPPRSIIDDRLSTVTWRITLAMAVLAAIALNITGLSVRVELSASTLVIISGYAALAIYCRFVRQNVEVARALIGFGQLVSVIVLGIMLNYAVSTVALPCRDAELYAIDRWLGFERESYIAFLRQHDGLLKLLYCAYSSLLFQNIFVLLATIIARRIDRLQMYIVAFAIAVTATAAIVIFIPAASAMIYVDKVPLDISTLSDGGHNHYPVLAGLRNGTLRVVDFSCVEGLITFPSFHTANALLFVWALWPVRSSLRLILVPLNLLLIASTPLFGAHYVTDIVGGVAVTFGAVVAANWLARKTSASERLAGAITASQAASPVNR